MRWLPDPREVEDLVVVPAGVPAATYCLDVAILSAVEKQLKWN